MRNIFVAMLLSLASLPAFEIHAQNAEIISESKSHGIPFYSAADNSVIAFTGSSAASFTPLTFTRYKTAHGHHIKSKKHGSVFVLEKGNYQISFTGTFQATSVAIPLNEASEEKPLLDLGVQLGSKFIAINMQNVESDYDNIQILSATEIIHISKKTKISIVARNRQDQTLINVLHRSLGIIRLN